MSMLDQIDPNLRDVVERLRGDPTSLLYRGGQGAFPMDFDADRLRPMSKDASARKAERHLLERYSEELAVWLLRGVFLEKARLGILPWAIRYEDVRSWRKPSTQVEFEAGCKILNGWPSTGPEGAPVGMPGLARPLLQAMAARIATPGDLLQAATLAGRLATFPEAANYAAQLELDAGRPQSAVRIALAAARLHEQDGPRSSLEMWAGLGMWRLEALDGAASQFLSAYRRLGTEASPSACFNLIACSLAGASVLDADSLVAELVQLEGNGSTSLGWLVRTMRHGARDRHFGSLSRRALTQAAADAPEPLRTRILDEH